jgi:hypothetical protein
MTIKAMRWHIGGFSLTHLCYRSSPRWGTVMRMFLTAFALAVTFAPVPSFAQVSLDNAFQVRYASNLQVADAVINITNTGARGGVGLGSGTSASTGGAICANVYTFSPDEQMISCCSCPVTPNGLVSLSAQEDLISNTLTPAVPTSIVIKLLATVPVGGSCTGSAAAVTTATLAPGLVAWGTSVHVINTVVGTQGGMIETVFQPSTLSASELNRLGTLCTLINANGSGFGVCRSCRLGGLSVP